MKKLSTIILLLASYIGYSQVGAMATFDFTQALNMTESINAGLEQLDQIDKMLDYYEKVEEKIQKVNKVILKLERVKDIVTGQRKILNGVEKAKKFITSLSSTELKKAYTSNLSDILKESQRVSNELSNITRDNYLNLTDKERIEMIEKYEKKIKILKARLRVGYGVN
ncbi:hypothetical protein [Capnocytophaga sp. oral taxon 878]|uniref:hypothetical protein n=1 Tax=Capnocytophaga sp. oral taxon 878 TaxID=1316596 RepID=UPI000D026204|nr:hypothetical protein [Capnocytophaga sp. oral taxon 878]AVM51549.1 hypothetical protein C4H12_13605 [Capnocytophaga sp. oral taxon 878]